MVADVGALMRGYSLEATFPTPAELAAVRQILPADKAIYLSAPQGHAAAQLVAAAVDVRGAGFEPVPHIAAHNYESHDELAAVLDRLSREAKVRAALVIGGDRPRPAGSFADAQSVIESGLLEEAGIAEIGIAG
jgi:methylenetetrahydrofolate reductase (NADPH)